MRLATLRDGSRDGALIVVDAAGEHYAEARDVAPSLQAALDGWERAEPALRERAEKLERGAMPRSRLSPEALAAPLPRAYEWIDGSSYLNHVRLARKARGAEPPPGLETDPLVYQGGSSVLLGPRDALVLPDPSWGLDFEAEVCVVLGDVARGIRSSDAERSLCLLMLANDVTYRNLVPAELAKGFGFFCSKPATAFSPFAVTPDELGDAFRDGRVRLPLVTSYNGRKVGDPDAGVGMQFSFFDLVEHVARTRAFSAGTILGGGTVSNADRARGASCLAELRALEIIASGAATTEYMAVGDTIRIEMLDAAGRSIFGAIEQRVVSA